MYGKEKKKIDQNSFFSAIICARYRLNFDDPVIILPILIITMFNDNQFFSLPLFTNNYIRLAFNA